MSAHAYALSVLPDMYGAKETRTVSKAKIHFAELVRPDSYWPQPYTIEQAFQVYRWLIKTGKPFAKYGEYGAYDLMIGRGVMGSSDLHYEPIRSLPMLRERFHRAILGRSNGLNANDWRRRERIAFGQNRVITFPHYAPFLGTPLLGTIRSEASLRKILDSYFTASGNLRVQLNECHSAAIEIKSLVVNVETYDFQFRFDLHYGYDGSSWTHNLATGEQFIDTFGAALVEFERVSGQSLAN